jgi:hypothetical protein
VPRAWLRDVYWKQASEQPYQEFPEYLVLQLAPRPGVDRSLPGWDGRVKVPVVAVVDIPEPVVSERSNAVEQLYFTEGFMQRISSDWNPAWAFTYPAIGGSPLADDLPIVREILFDGLKGGDAPRLDRAIASAPDAFYPINPQVGGDGLRLKLDHVNRSDHIASEGRALERLAAVVEAFRAVGEAPTIKCATVPSSSLAPPLREPPPATYDRILVRFSDLNEILPGEKALRKALPERDIFVRYRQGIEQLQAVRFVVDHASFGLNIAFVVALLFVIGILAYLHSAAKTPETAVLRTFGLSARGVVQLFLAQLGLLIMPACVAGLVLAWGAARALNDCIAERLAPVPPGTPLPRIFASCQAFDPWSPLVIVGWTMAILVVATVLAVGSTSRRPITDGLRATY